MPTNGAMSDLMDFREACDYLQVTRKTLLKLVAEGAVPAVKLGAGPRAPYRFLRSAILERLETDFSVDVEGKPAQ